MFTVTWNDSINEAEKLKNSIHVKPRKYCPADRCYSTILLAQARCCYLFDNNGHVEKNKQAAGGTY